MELSAGDLGARLSPLQAQYSRQLGGLVDAAAVNRRGRVVFFAGTAGSGRSFLLQWLAAALPREQPKPVVIAGRFHDRRYLPWSEPQDRPVPADVENLITATVAPGSGLLGPAGPLVVQLVSLSQAAYNLLQRLRRERRREEVTELLPRLLRAAATAGPVVCLVDDMDAAEGSWWVSLLLSFAQEINEELPLVFCLVVDAPAELGPPQDDEPNAYYVGRRLVERGLAEWWPLRPLTAGQIDAWLGPLAPELLTVLCQISDGTAGELVELWRDWQQRGVIEQAADGSWRHTGNGDGTLADAADSLGGRLRTLLGGDSARELDQAREVLACAALEGRIFTAQAVARALGRDSNQLIEFLDNRLVASEDHPHGLLGDLGSLTIHPARGAARHLRRYGFQRQLDRRVARDRFLTDAERRQLARRLASALAQLYSPEVDRVAPALDALFTCAGDHEQARRFRTVARFGASQAVLRTQARQLLDQPTEDADRYELQRAADLLLVAAEALLGTDPYPETLAVAEHAGQLATQAHAVLARAQALYLQALLRTELGEYDRATQLLREAQRTLDRRVPASLEVQILNQFALIDLKRGNFRGARQRWEELLPLTRALGDRAPEATTYHQLGMVALKTRDAEAARQWLTQALSIREETGDRAGEAATCHQLGWLALFVRDYQAAGRWLERALSIVRELGDRASEAATYHALGVLALTTRDDKAARRRLRQALSIRLELGDRSGAASTYHELGVLALKTRDNRGARRWLKQALAIRLAIADRAGAASTQRALDTLPPGT